MKKELLLLLALAGFSATYAQKVAVEKVFPQKDYSTIKVQSLENPSITTAKVVSRNTNYSPSSVLNLETRAAETGVSYLRPFGTFYWGLTEDTGSLSITALLSPAYATSTWYNTSTAAGPYTWRYANAALTEYVESSDKHLTTPEYPYTQIDAPILTANNITFGEKTMLQPGGAATYKDDKGNINVYGAANYNIQDGKPKIGVFGIGSSADETWASLFADDDDIVAVKATGFGELYEKPEHPYALSNVWVHVNAKNVPKAAEFKLTVYKVNEKGEIGEELAYGTCDGSEIRLLEGGVWSVMNFNLKAQKGLFVEDVVLTVNSAILIKITGEGDNIGDITPFWLGQTYTTEKIPYTSNGYQFVDITSKKEGVLKDRLFNTTNIVFEGKLASTGFLFNLGVIYTWLECEDTTFDAPIGGGSKSFTIKSFWGPSLDDKTIAWQVSGEPEWLTHSINEDGVITFTAAALSNADKGRSANVTLSCPGASLPFTISQGNITGISNIEATAIKVVCNGEDFQLTYPEGINTVSIINIAGQAIDTYELPTNGTYTIPAAKLNKGMYLLKFNNNTTIKVIK